MIKKVITFKLDEKILAIELSKIKEVARNVACKQLPDQPLFIEGLINLRGTYIPLIDLKRRFFLGLCDNELSNRIFIIYNKSNLIAFQVESMQNIIELDFQENLQDYIDLLYIKRPFINGVATLKDDLVILIDPDKLFDEIELELLSRIKES
jgi:purine-binding chemotaxis protein CheW